MKKYTRAAAGRKLEKKDFFLVFNAAFQKSMTVADAQGAFPESGIFTRNPSAIPQHALTLATVCDLVLATSSTSGMSDVAMEIANPVYDASWASPPVMVTTSSLATDTAALSAAQQVRR